MNEQKTVILTVKQNYGSIVYYPANETAQLIARLLKTKTISSSEFKTIEALGFKIESHAWQPVCLYNTK